jgi:hypothetical protein
VDEIIEPSADKRIVRWKILEGLPGEGPAPKYFHVGHPTPWAEGVAIRFWHEDGTEWIGNFQGGAFRYSNVALWPEEWHAEPAELPWNLCSPNLPTNYSSLLGHLHGLRGW